MDTQHIKVHQLKYDVFISFRGQDTRENLVSHIKRSLVKKGISVFDDDDMGSGREITPAVLKAIRKSMISVILFSKNFASSPWCLDELMNIMECKRTLKQKVIPVFYNVDPSDIEELKGSFAEDLAKHESNYKYKEKVHVWRSALKEASSLTGLDSKNIRPDATLVQKIVRDVLILINGQSPSYLQDNFGLPSVGMGYPSMYPPSMGAPSYFTPPPLMRQPLPFYGSTPPLMFGIDDFHSPPPLMDMPPPLMGLPPPQLMSQPRPFYGSTPPLTFGIDDFHSPPLMDMPPPLMGLPPPQLMSQPRPFYGSTPPLTFGIDDFHSPPLMDTPPPLMGSSFLPSPLPPAHSSFMFLF